MSGRSQFRRTISHGLSRTHLEDFGMCTPHRLPTWLSTPRRTATFAAWLFCIGCGGDSLGPSSNIQVNVRTSGASPDPDGYTVRLGDRPGQPVAVNGTLVFPALADGNYSVLLSGIAANCAVQGPNPRPIAVLGSSVSVDFAVTCEQAGPPPPPPPSSKGLSVSPDSAVAGSPDLTVTLTGTGFAHRPHFFSVVKWSVGQQTIALPSTFVSDRQLTTVIPAILLGHPTLARIVVETGDPMSDLPPASVGTAFTVTPAPPPSGTGTILVYGIQRSPGPPWRLEPRAVSLDGSAWRPFAAGDSVFYRNVPAGDHQLRISNPCTGSHAPTVLAVTLLNGETKTVGASMYSACE